jgi:tetratricopeptide (TPR) repeat protein
MADNPRIDDLRRRVQKDPASIAFAQLAEEYRRAGQCDEAVQVCRSGLTIHPGYLSARVTLGRALIELGQLESAQHELQMVLVSAPDNLAAIRGLAEIMHRRGAIAEALVHYQRALGLARNDPDLEQTVAELTRAVARTPARGAAPAAVTVAPAAELMSLEQLTQELQASVAMPAPAAVATTIHASTAVATAVMPAREVSTVSRAAAPVGETAHAGDWRTLSMLERWLTAIDGFRAARGA